MPSPFTARAAHLSVPYLELLSALPQGRVGPEKWSSCCGILPRTDSSFDEGTALILPALTKCCLMISQFRFRIPEVCLRPLPSHQLLLSLLPFCYSSWVFQQTICITAFSRLFPRKKITNKTGCLKTGRLNNAAIYLFITEYIARTHYMPRLSRLNN